MSHKDEINAFHKNAKDAGNRLSALITNASMGAVGVFFFALTGKAINYTTSEKLSLLVALAAFVVASFLRLLELHFDARRFYATAIQLENEDKGIATDWTVANNYKNKRMTALWWSYGCFAAGVIFSFVFMVLRIV